MSDVLRFPNTAFTVADWVALEVSEYACVVRAAVGTQVTMYYYLTKLGKEWATGCCGRIVVGGVGESMIPVLGFERTVDAVRFKLECM